MFKQYVIFKAALEAGSLVSMMVLRSVKPRFTTILKQLVYGTTASGILNKQT